AAVVGEGDLGLGVQMPEDVDRLVRFEFVAHQEAGVAEDADAALHPGGAGGGVGLGQVDDRELVFGGEGDELGGGLGILVFAVEREGVLAFGAEAVVVPALAAEV